LAPTGAWSLVLRLFHPHASAVSGAWAMPPLERVGANLTIEHSTRRIEPHFLAPVLAGFGRRLFSGTSS
jgi:hypothetical protein